jgi:hypothetical protein
MNLKIVSATYGNKDVKNILEQNIKDNSLNIFADNKLFGDPQPNIKKYLRVTYSYNNIIRNEVIEEGNKLRIGKDIPVKRNKDMKFIIPAPDSQYYMWQILVQINHFREMGYEQDMHIPVYFFNKPSKYLLRLLSYDKFKCHFYIYPNDKKDKSYAAGSKPYLMYRFFDHHPEMQKYTYNLLDPDVIFTRQMDFNKFLGDDTWYGSDVASYVNINYIKSKDEAIPLFEDMCRICEVDPQVVINNDKTGTVGAQYIIKNNTPELWYEIYDKGNKLYSLFKKVESDIITGLNSYNPDKFAYKKGDTFKHQRRKWTVKEDHISDINLKPENEGKLYSKFEPIQAWTAEMWSTIYVALKHKIKLQVSEDMKFHWANHDISKWDSKAYFHNAGITAQKPNGKDFCKRAYEKQSPFKKEIPLQPQSASNKYVELIRRTEKEFAELIWD